MVSGEVGIYAFGSSSRLAGHPAIPGARAGFTTARGTALALVVGVASASSCNFKVPPIRVKKGARLSHFACDGLSSSCCSGMEDVVSLTGSGKAMSPGQVMKDTIGPCGRADQVIMYDCAVSKAPQIVPVGKGCKLRQIIKSRGGGNVLVKSTSMGGSGHCSLSQGAQIDGVSTACCAAGGAVADELEAERKRQQLCWEIFRNQNKEDWRGGEAAFHERLQKSDKCKEEVNRVGEEANKAAHMWHDRGLWKAGSVEHSEVCGTNEWQGQTTPCGHARLA